jgi:hypothetical protein
VLGKIAALRSPSDYEGEIVLTDDYSKELRVLLDEGAYFVTGLSAGKPVRVPIRRVALENGVSVLRYDPRELRDGTPFEAGMLVTAQRSYSFGNLRDSDAEPAVFSFADEACGTRAGQPYPLWNWCVLFSGFGAGE